MSTQGSRLVAVVICFLVLAVIAVALRCYVRIRLTGGFGVDDALSVASLIIFLLGSACLLVGVSHGAFGHRWMSISQPMLVLGLKLLFIYELAYITATCLVKLSISLFLLRFTIERKYAWTLYIVLAILFSYSFFLLLFALFQCKPISAFWQPQGHCDRSGTVKVTYAHSVIVSASDWTLIILPIFLVHHLNLRFRSKVYVGVLLTIGSCACIATLARFAYVHYLIDPRNLFSNTSLLITSHLEVGVALTASSMATLRPLLIRLRGGSSSWSRSQSQASDQPYLNRRETVGRHPRHEQVDEIHEIDVELGESS